LPDGRWRGAVSLGYENGKHIRKWVQREARGDVVDAIKDLVSRKKANQPIHSARRTVATFIADWLADEVKPNRNASTFRIYGGMVRLYILPQLGRIRLDQLNGLDVQRCLNGAAKHLSPSSVRLLSTILRTALRCGERRGVVAGNAAKHTSLPTQVKHDAKPLTAEQASLPASRIRRAASANGRDRGVSGRRGVLRKEPEFDGTATDTVTSVEPAPFAMAVGEGV
jgi:integrase